MLYVDNPVGSGFSYTDSEGYAKDMGDVATDMYTALVQFFKLFPWLRKNEFFIAGESYAGRYIPAIGNTIFEKNKVENFQINLQVC